MLTLGEVSARAPVRAPPIICKGYFYLAMGQRRILEKGAGRFLEPWMRQKYLKDDTVSVDKKAD
jgi:hypothetical protein